MTADLLLVFVGLLFGFFAGLLVEGSRSATRLEEERERAEAQLDEERQADARRFTELRVGSELQIRTLAAMLAGRPPAEVQALADTTPCRNVALWGEAEVAEVERRRKEAQDRDHDRRGGGEGGFH